MVITGAEKWMTRCGAMMLVYSLSIVLIGTRIQYTNPHLMVFWIVMPMVDQVCSYLELRVIEISMISYR